VFVSNKIFIHLLALLTLAGTEAASLQTNATKAHPVRAHKHKPPDQQKSAAAATANYGKYDFTLATLDGKTIRLSEYAGTVVLVSLWAPWCGPCRLETPGFVKLYNQYKGKGFKIIGVAVNTNEGDVRSFMQSYGVTWPVGIKDDVARAYGTYGLPDSYLFRRDGSLSKQFIGFTKPEALTPFVEAALK